MSDLVCTFIKYNLDVFLDSRMKISAVHMLGSTRVADKFCFGHVIRTEKSSQVALPRRSQDRLGQ